MMHIYMSVVGNGVTLYQPMMADAVMVSHKAIKVYMGG